MGGAQVSRSDGLRTAITHWTPSSDSPTALVAVSLLVAVATWTPEFIPPTSGLDPSWHAGLFMGEEQGLDHGSDIAFTYGPLGALGVDGGELWFGGLAVAAVLFQSVLYLALCWLTVYALRRSVGLLLAGPLAFAALVVVDSPEVVLVIVAALVLIALSPDPPGWSTNGLTIAGATLAAVESLVKLSLGPLIFVVVLLALIGARASPRRIAVFAAIFLVELLFLWLIAGQSLSALPDYVGNARQLIGGYSDGFGVVSYDGWYVPAATVILVALVIATAATAGPDRRRRVFAVLCVFALGFTTFKESVVRLDPPHVPIFLSTALMIWLVMRWRGRGRALVLVGAVPFAALVLQVSALDKDAGANPLTNARRLVATAKTTLKPSRRDEIAAVAKTQMQNYYDVPSRVLDAVGDRPVAVLPFEIAVAWAYDLNWDPLPVIQSYAAYTSHLDRLNADALSRPDGPERILRHNLTEIDGRTFVVDGRLESWEAPAQTVAMVCNFERQVTTGRWQVLSRVPNRCGEPADAGSVEAESNEAVDVPAAEGDLVVARLHGIGLTWFEKLQSLLLRADPRYLAYDGAKTFRVTPATADDGFLVSAPRSIAGSGPFRLAPNAHTLRVLDAPAPVRFDFFRVPIDDPTASSGTHP